ncbi:MAG: HAMP domain-containing protein [Pirellulales bacterium]|nr:HAMP domain-containing protein [Pirellulales bacterium]
MKSHSFFAKLYLGNLLLVAIVITVSLVFAYLYLDREYHYRQIQHQQQVVELLRLHFEETWPRTTERINAECRKIGQLLPMRVTVIDHRGCVLGDSEYDYLGMDNHKTPDRPEVIQALQGKVGQASRFSTTTGIEYQYLSRPIRFKGQVVAIARAAMPFRKIAQDQKFILGAMGWTTVAAASVTVVLGLLLSWLWFAPIRQITHAARRIASGELTHRANISGPHELVKLGEALNEMGQNISMQIETIAAQRENLAAVVANLSEGIVALDANRDIILMNRSAASLFASDKTNLIGQNIETVVQVPEAIAALDELSSENDISRQLCVHRDGKRHIVNLQAVEIPQIPAGGIRTLIVAHDLTDVFRTAEIKTEFVANASHELRTPLATIRAAVDSLPAVGPVGDEAFDRVCDILNRHTARLEDIIKDLLDLHLIESTKQRLRLEPIRIASLAKWAKDHFAESARDKRVHFIVDGCESFQQINSDRTLLQLILQNLIDNAIKFTNPGGRVECSFQLSSGQLRICVSDTGCGIPTEFQDRVFERFFQAEPSRAGDSKIRGTGLGLAIVKHAAERLAASVSLTSEPDRGTGVQILLPIERISTHGEQDHAP